MRVSRLGAGILAAALLAAGAPGLPADAASGRGAATHAKRKTIDTPGTRTRHIVLQWRGDAKAKRFERSVGVPGIGDLTMTCRPDETRISLEADDASAETQMWMAKYEDKPYGAAVAVKTVRIYRYQHWYDQKGHGTSNPQSEGLNQRSGKNGVENWASGYAHGIISQRGARNAVVGADPLKPVTTFELNWYWNGFDYPAEYRSCRMEITAVTQLDTRLGPELAHRQRRHRVGPAHRLRAGDGRRSAAVRDRPQRRAAASPCFPTTPTPRSTPRPSRARAGSRTGSAPATAPTTRTAAGWARCRCPRTA